MMWIIYLIGVLDELLRIITVLWSLALIASIIFTVVFFVFRPDEFDMTTIKKNLRWSRKLKKLIISVIISGILFSFIPNSKTLAAMYLIPKIAANEQVQQIPNKALEVLNLKLDEWVSDLAKTKEKR